MVAELKLAVAGSGKTTWLGKHIDPDKNNLLITFTNQNVNNITESIQKHIGYIPENTFVMTFTRFVYYWLIRPFERSFEINKIDDVIHSKGIDILSPIEFDRYNLDNGYCKDNNVYHYLSFATGRLYSSRLSKLYVKQSEKIRKIVRNNLDQYLDDIFVDEFQDFCAYDFKVLVDLVKCKKTNLHFVGDYFQSQVSQTNFKNRLPYNKVHGLDEFVDLLKSKKINIDQETLKKSWRCPDDTCEFIRSKLYIPILAAQEKEGGIKQITDVQKGIEILNNENIVKLFWDSGINGFSEIKNANKWGYSKGDTYDSTCVILTKSTNSIVHSSNLKIPMTTRNKLYVALTRSLGDTFLMDSVLYNKCLKRINKL